MNHTNTGKRLRLNCDMGESFGPWVMGRDEQVMPLVDMANIACGFHASDPVTMARTVRLAKQAGVCIGAHPAYPDLVGFGRRSMQCSAEEITALIQYQVGALHGICRAQGVALTYVKPHGALYNDMMRDDVILRAVLEGVAGLQLQLPLMILARPDNSHCLSLAKHVGVELLFEAFADRVYNNNGYLLPRTEAGSVHHDAAKILQQSLQLAREGAVTTTDGTLIHLQADSLCVHGDNAESVAAVKSIRLALDDYYGKH